VSNLSNLWNLTKPKTPEDFANYDRFQDERKTWFDKIVPNDNWKNPIDVWIDRCDFDNCNRAAVWFTGAELDIVASRDDQVHVRSPGYYANIGA